MLRIKRWCHVWCNLLNLRRSVIRKSILRSRPQWLGFSLRIQDEPSTQKPRKNIHQAKRAWWVHLSQLQLWTWSTITGNLTSLYIQRWIYRLTNEADKNFTTILETVWKPRWRRWRHYPMISTLTWSCLTNMQSKLKRTAQFKRPSPLRSPFPFAGEGQLSRSR